MLWHRVRTYISVAQAAGHDPKVLHDSYADVIERRSVFNTLELIHRSLDYTTKPL
jgi:hypothetical protein